MFTTLLYKHIISRKTHKEQEHYLTQYLKLLSQVPEMRSGRVQKLQGGRKKTPDSLHLVYTDPKAEKEKTELPFNLWNGGKTSRRQDAQKWQQLLEKI